MPIIVLVIAAYGWQAAAVVAAVAYLVIILPLVPFLKESPESMGLLPDGATPAEVAAARKAASQSDPVKARHLMRHYESVDFSLRETLHTPAFWFLLGGTMFRKIGKATVQVHIIAILVWKGHDTGVASLIFAVGLGMTVPAKLLIGYFGDRVPKRVILGGGMLVYALAMVLLMKPSSAWTSLAAVVLIGLSGGTTVMNWAAVGDYFGRRYYATLRGIISLSHSWASVVVPFAAGWWFDRTGSYTAPLILAAVTAVIAGALYALIRRPDPPARSHGRSPAPGASVSELRPTGSPGGGAQTAT